MVKKILKQLAFVLFIIILSYIHIQLHVYAEDDAYIHFRIAENFAQFGRPYFNINEPVFTTSSTVWTILLAGLSFLPIKLPLLISILNAFLLGVGGIIFTKIANNFTDSDFLNWSIPVIYAGILMQSSIGLMETPLAMMVLGFGILSYIKNVRSCWFLLSLSIFIRLELMIFFIVLLLFSINKKSFQSKHIIIYSLMGILPFLIFEVYFFQAIIPNTIIAKSIIYQLDRWTFLRNLLQNTLPNVEIIKSISPYWQIVYLSLIMILVGYFILTRIIKKRSISLNHILISCGTIIITVYIIQNVILFPWYIPLFMVPIVVGLICLNNSNYSFLNIVFALLVSLPFFLNFFQTLAASVINPQFYVGFESGARVRNYIKIGADLYSKFPDATLMTSEIGGLGYSFKGYIVDAAGLASPRALIYHPMEVEVERSSGNIGAIPVDLIKEIKPEIIVSYDVFIEAFINSSEVQEYVWVKKPIFVEQDLMQYHQNSFWYGENINLFFRKEFLSSTK